MAECGKQRSGRKPGTMKATEQIYQLFISMNGCENIKNSLYDFNQALRKLNPKYKNAAQIRQSVITEWLKEKDLRTVQYMAGHKYVSSTERYQTSNLEDLKDIIRFDIEWPEKNGKTNFIFEDVYWTKINFNFGIVADETILSAIELEESDQDLQNLNAKWGEILKDVKLKVYQINFNSTGSEIKIIAKGFREG